MQQDLKKKENKELKDSYPKSDQEIAYRFSAELQKELGKFLKGVVLFGSKARHKKKYNDIDILILMDDVSVEVTEEFIQTYRIIVNNLVANISKKLHITTFKLTSFWELVRKGDPVAVNILRDGVPIIDREIFRPLQILLFQGRIKPSKESMWQYYYKSAKTIVNAKLHILRAAIDLYWAVMDAAQATLMTIHEIPPSPEHVHEIFQKRFIQTKIFDKKYSNIIKEFYDLNKKIESRHLKSLSGRDYDLYNKKAEDFVSTMKKFIEKETLD